MSFENMPTAQLTALARSGAGFRVVAGIRPFDDLWQIAEAAGASGARVTLAGLGMMPIENLIRLGTVGQGSVTVEL